MYVWIFQRTKSHTHSMKNDLESDWVALSCAVREEMCALNVFAIMHKLD